MLLLEKLTNAIGAPGDESEVRKILIDHLAKLDLEAIIDHSGNLFFVKEGKTNKPRIMLDAHMDEVALQVMGYSSDGELRIQQLGGIDDRVLGSKYVLVGSERIKGVIGLPPIHTQERDSIETVYKTKNLVIDIGAKDKEEAEKLAPIGTTVVFDTEFELWENNVVKGKSFDDRAGCWAVAKALVVETECTLIASFTFGEELGMKGAALSARCYEPDLVISLEGTTAGDMPEVPEHQMCCKMWGGPVITFEDKGIIIPKKLRLLLEETAKKNNIPYQYKGTVTGGTNAGAMQFEAGGTQCVVIAAPCRYIHSPVSLATKQDLEQMVELTKAFIQTIDKEGIPS